MHLNLHLTKLKLKSETKLKDLMKTKGIVTGHPVEEPLASAVVGLQEATVHRPVQVGDERRRTAALTNLLVALCNSINVYQTIVGSYRQEVSIWRKLELMDYLFPVFDVNHLRHIPKQKHLLVNSITIRRRHPRLPGCPK